MRGDFNNGGYDDRAAGTLGESVGDAEDSGFTLSARGYAIRETAPLTPGSCQIRALCAASFSCFQKIWRIPR